MLWSPLALTAPSVSGVSPDLNNEELTISGSGFGGGPRVVMFETFEGGPHGQAVSADSPRVGEWVDVPHPDENRRAWFTESAALSGSYSAVMRYTDQSSQTFPLVFGVKDSSGFHGLEPFQEIYFSYSVKDLREFPGRNGTNDSFSDISSTKDAWLMLGNRGDNTSLTAPDGNQGHDLYVPAWTGSGFNIAGNQTRMSPAFWQNEITNRWSFSGWNTKFFHAALNPNDPYGEARGFFGFVNENGYFMNHRAGNFMSNQEHDGVSPYWDRIKFIAWLRTDDRDVKRVMDNVYVAIGSNANARVVVADRPNLNVASEVHHLLPLHWSDSEIVLDVGAANLPSDRAWYVFVIDAQERVVDTGFSYCPKCPDAPVLSGVH